MGFYCTPKSGPSLESGGASLTRPKLALRLQFSVHSLSSLNFGGEILQGFVRGGIF